MTLFQPLEKKLKTLNFHFNQNPSFGKDSIIG